MGKTIDTSELLYRMGKYAEIDVGEEKHDAFMHFMLLLTRTIEKMPNVATVYKGNIIKNLIMDCQSYTKYRPNETTGGIFVSWRRKEELPTGA